MNNEYGEPTIQEINEISLRQNRAVKFHSKPKDKIIFFSFRDRFTRTN